MRRRGRLRRRGRRRRAVTRRIRARTSHGTMYVNARTHRAVVVRRLRRRRRLRGGGRTSRIAVTPFARTDDDAHPSPSSLPRSGADGRPPAASRPRARRPSEVLARGYPHRAAILAPPRVRAPPRRRGRGLANKRCADLDRGMRRRGRLRRRGRRRRAVTRRIRARTSHGTMYVNARTHRAVVVRRLRRRRRLRGGGTRATRSCPRRRRSFVIAGQPVVTREQDETGDDRRRHAGGHRDATPTAAGRQRPARRQALLGVAGV